MQADYAAFLNAKAQDTSTYGFSPMWMPDFLFGFQRALTEWAIAKGKAAIFADCGLGKTPVQLVWAENVVRKTNKPVLIFTPLAVAAQTIREADKFGIEAHRSNDGQPARGITVTNYEKIHRFNPNDYAGVVCDECFPPDAMVERPLGSCYIKDVRVGDIILNAAGYDRVSNVHRREVKSAIRVTIKRRLWKGPKPVDSITSSPNHPYFTQRGWVCAQDLQPGDSVMATSEAVRMVRERCNPDNEPGSAKGFLRQVLLGEMADESGGFQGLDIHAGAASQDRCENTPMVGAGLSRSGPSALANSESESHGQPRYQAESLPDIESHEPQTFRAWGKREGSDRGAVLYGEGVRGDVDNGVCLVTGPTSSRISDLLQARLGESRKANQYRGGWSLSSLAQGVGPKEGCETGFSRVESLEVLEPGHPDLERYRDGEGRIYFYDVGATRHPSFSVNGLLVHNSSAIKSFDGKRRAQVTEFMRTIPYRLLCTATAAPNDYVELGTSSEALGVMGAVDMMGRFFKNDQNTVDTKGKFKGYSAPRAYTFKGHAEIPFFRWVCSWARACRKPSDLGFPDDAFRLPELIEREHVVKAHNLAEGFLFETVATNRQEELEECRRTIKERCEKAAELVAYTGKPFVVWCHLNPEGDLLDKLLADAVQVSGADSDEEKEEAYEAFASGQSRGMISKQKIGGWGLNWQHCAHVVEFASHSFEGHYQGVRRCWRFGQKNQVINDIIATEGQRGIRENQQRKAAAADRMFELMVKNMSAAMKIDGGYKFETERATPSWL